MTTSLTLFGEELSVDSTKREAAIILREYPATASDPGLFNFQVLRHRCKWVSQLPEARQIELRAFCRDLESLRRRRQEAVAELRSE